MAKYRIKEHLETVYDKNKVDERIKALQKIVDSRQRGGKVISEHKQTGKVHQWLLYYVKE
ncbi:hypothetical protein SEA_EVY_161 [Streptomyces phage Evy]|uniref:Uncharacterized protein n=1 Tax=Streptomyces phage Evy TaxID=2588514 RepID=A0A514DK83_9CAUD|nr:hypothetical protein KNU67_gp127 [Streptomyces phage Evy]QDH94005.1 hypothetical protein SEA_EVY_161 [Streptomyces phage Evy]UEM46926.1 hypothetical protein SEA_TARGARYEN_167 [Streptomyces phage Targaryen]